MPNLTVPESISVGVWGQRHLWYIREYRKTFYIGLQLSGELNSYLADVDQQAEKVFFQLVNQLSELEGITKQLKIENQMEWIQRMNSIRNRVEEIIYNDLISV